MTRLALLAGALAGCAWGPGGPMGEVTVTLEAAWTVPADRDAGGGWQRLASDYQVRITTATWTAAHLALIDSGGAALTFDPANPPPGYSLCHNGHCHADDGRLVDYEDISAELSGGAAASPVLELAVGELELAAGTQVALACDGAPCELPRAEIGRVELEVTAIAIAGVVRDGQQPPRIAEAPFTVTLAGIDAHATGRLALPVDRSAPPRIALDVAALPTAAVLDGVDWAALAGDPLDLTTDPAATAAITEALGELELSLDVRRMD